MQTGVQAIKRESMTDLANDTMQRYRIRTIAAFTMASGAAAAAAMGFLFGLL
jgi:hypothetical protein